MPPIVNHYYYDVLSVHATILHIINTTHLKETDFEEEGETGSDFNHNQAGENPE